MITEIHLNLPKIETNRVVFSWDPPGPFLESSYWVKYPDLVEINASPGKLTEAYLPVCLGLAALGNVRFRLPVRLDPGVLDHWARAIETAGRRLFRARPEVEFVNGTLDPGYQTPYGNRTVLFYGGGTNSLLALARLLEKEVKPILASIGGPNWPGSNPEINPDKFALDEVVSSDFSLELLRIRTNFRELIDAGRWSPLLKPGLSALSSLLAVPQFIATLLPVAEQFGIRTCASGNARAANADETFCFSPAMADLLKHVGRGLFYESQLTHLQKEAVCQELYGKHPHMARYQYSCWRNRRRRWCYQCQSCLEYYMLLKANGLAVSTVGLDESEIKRHIVKLILAVARSPQARRGEIWPRVCRYAVLRRDSSLRKVLDAIRVASLLHRHYLKTPDSFKKLFRWIKSFPNRARLRRQLQDLVQEVSY